MTRAGFSHQCNEEFDKPHYDAIKESDPAVRNDMYIQMQQLWDEAVHTAWLGWPTRYFGTRQDSSPVCARTGESSRRRSGR